MRALKKAIKIAGSQAALARELGVDKSQVTRWIEYGHVPPKHRIKIEVWTDGKIRATEF